VESKVAASSQVQMSLIISGSTVAVVGMTLMITSTYAFIGMVVFGLAAVTAGVVMAKRAKTGEVTSSPRADEGS
jgi:hypothetical protein